MSIKDNKTEEMADHAFEGGAPYLDTSRNHLSEADHIGGSPYLDESSDPSIQANNTGGSPYLDTDDEPSIQTSVRSIEPESHVNSGMEIAGNTAAIHDGYSNKI